MEFKNLTLREKIGQTVMIKANPDEHKRLYGSLEAFLEKYPVGGIFIGAEIIKAANQSAKDLRQMVREYQEASKIPLLVAADVEAGAGRIASDLAELPTLMSLGATESEELAYEYGRVSALEATALGINWAFAPVADLNLNRYNVITNYRSVSDDPDKAIRLLTEVIKGMQDHGMAATAKHFPGDGVDHRDQHLVTSCNSLCMEQWNEKHGRVFQKLVDAGVYSVMCGHISFPAYQKKKFKDCYLPATLSDEVTTELLKKQMGFQGVVVSDAMDMGGFVRWYEERDIAEIECMKAGVDVMLWPFLSFFDNMEAAIRRGEVSMERLEDAVLRVTELKKKLGVFSKDLVKQDIFAENTAFAKNIAKRIAQKSITLVANELNLLPLDCEEIKKVRIVGLTPDHDLFQKTECLAGELKKRGAVVEVRRDFITYGRDFKTLDRDYDLLLYVLFYRIQRPLGTIHYYGDEARSIVSSLAFDRKKTVVISFGSPYYYREYFESAETFVNAYSSDEETIKAFVAAIYGEIPWEGKSPVLL